ncbi:hypothetical protein [Candidatus Pantoea deserta]|uniref:hypothetical protein n=1 Tax=Candidatus Pantoea deserta TaxID=1869313 RepID=UPI000F4E0E04|nr:hypothetical protein [Pantoea deserta]
MAFVRVIVFLGVTSLLLCGKNASAGLNYSYNISVISISAKGKESLPKANSIYNDNASDSWRQQALYQREPFPHGNKGWRFLVIPAPFKKINKNPP